jgi:hypothetical protein
VLEKPDALNLLYTARSTLIEDVLGSVPEDSRLATLMVAKAIAIAIREIEDSVETRIAAELDRLQNLYEGEDEDGADPSISLPQRIVNDLRAGKLATHQLNPLRAYLRQMTRARLQVSNPKLLRALEAL